MTRFLETAIEAFPVSCRKPIEETGKALAPFIDDNYPFHFTAKIMVHGKPVLIPQRIHYIGLDKLPVPKNLSGYIQCLLSRSTDGYVRQRALCDVLKFNESWAVPFVVLLAGEYVVEIIQEMVASLPAMQRNLYINFVLENQPVMRNLRSKAISYWNCYYRHSFPERRTYPGLVFLDQLNTWATPESD